jgi:hypothetical protein
MGRRRKQKFTYDSDETKAFLGLVALFGGALAILSYVIEGGVFAFIHSLTADATFFLGIFLFFLIQFSVQVRRSVLQIRPGLAGWSGIMSIPSCARISS